MGGLLCGICEEEDLVDELSRLHMHANDLDDHPRTLPGHQGKASIFAHTISRRAKHDRISISNYLNNLTYRDKLF